jgi:acetyl-CoA synthetase
LNAAIECCDRWARDGRIVLEWIGRDMERETVTFSALKADSERFASLLKKRGIGKRRHRRRAPAAHSRTADRGARHVAGRCAVYQPLFTAFGPKAIETRIAGDTGSGAKLVITDRANRSKLDEVQDCPPVIEVDRTCVTPSSLPRILADEPTVSRR